MLIDFGIGDYMGAASIAEQTVPPGTLHLRSPESVHSYRAAGRVVVELVMQNPRGAQPWSAVGAMLTDRTGLELKILPVWQRGFVETDRQRQHIVVEALAAREEAQGSFTLKLWEAGMGRTVSLSGISFP